MAAQLCLQKKHRMHVTSNLNTLPPPPDGLSLLNDDGGLRACSFPETALSPTPHALTHTITPRDQETGVAYGNDHIACYGGDPQTAQVTWHNSGGQLQVCYYRDPAPYVSCGPHCQGNGGIGVDPPLNGHTVIHMYMYTDSTAYVNQDLKCQVSGGQLAFVGVYLKNGGV